jgi:hypothetical protein
MDVLKHDPAIGGQDITVGPYAGTNSFIRVTRGDDGLGPIDVVVNAYIESEP